MDVATLTARERSVPLVFIHGLGGTRRYWQHGLAQVRPQLEVQTPELLGFGDAPKPWCRYTPERHLDWMSQQLAHIEAPMTLVGHSLGAVVVLMYAARYPHRVHKLVLISVPNFRSEKNAYRWMRRTPSGWLMTNIWVAALTCIFTRRVMGRLLPRILKDIPREVAEDLVKHTFVSSTSSLWDVLYRHDLMEDARHLPDTLPVTLIHAPDDETAPYAGAQALLRQFPAWRLFSIPGTQHHPWLYQAQRCWEVILGKE